MQYRMDSEPGPETAEPRDRAPAGAAPAARSTAPAVLAPAGRAGEGAAVRRVLHVVAPGDVGGLESVVGMLAAGHRRAGLDVRIAAVLSGGGGDAYVERLRASGVPVTAVRVGGRAYLAERAGVARVLRDFPAQVVHTHGYRTDVVDAGLGRRAGAATISTVHGFTGGSRKNRFNEWVQEWSLRRFDAVVAVAAPIVERLVRRGVPRDRIALLPNAYAPRADLLSRADARAALGLRADGRVVGWIGRLSHEKGPDVALGALARVPDRRVHLSIVGDGSAREALKQSASRSGLGDRVRWHGAVPEAARCLRAFDVVLLSSRTEGTPMVLLEALAAGVPVVATRVGGIPAVVDDGIEALLAPSEDAEAIAAAIASTLADPDSAAARASAGRARMARDHDESRWLAAYSRLYDSLLRVR